MTYLMFGQPPEIDVTLPESVTALAAGGGGADGGGVGGVGVGGAGAGGGGVAGGAGAGVGAGIGGEPVMAQDLAAKT
jgi:hypothetical protein